ncbi:hypothetical protein SNE40_014938 [Patella caerulea]|uniref:Uncharacterized protein n=1 Tax=Patella caerulea TaxID=87958 RepID=A0AAN8JFM5_PATCE
MDSSRVLLLLLLVTTSSQMYFRPLTKCFYNGRRYDVKDKFHAEDGCNFCICADSDDMDYPGPVVKCSTDPCDVGF